MNDLSQQKSEYQKGDLLGIMCLVGLLLTIFGGFALMDRILPNVASLSQITIPIGSMVLLIALYMAPWFLGLKRGISSSGALFLVNLLLGWTVIVWIICFVWAATASTKAQDAFYARVRL